MRHRHHRKYSRHPAVFLAAAGMAGLLAGCGQEQAVSVGAQTEIREDAPEIEDNSDSTSIVSGERQGTVNTTAAQSSPISSRPIEMDEETRQQLTAELLEESELDTAVMESGRVTRGCTFEVPEGFEESEETEGLYVTARYPLDSSMIYYEVMEQDTSMQLMTEELFLEQSEENLRLAYGEDIELTIDSFESVKIDGYPAFRILCRYEIDGIKVTQLQYAINADKSYMIIYSQTNDYDWMEAFEASAATIKVK